MPFTGRQNAYLATREAVHILRLSLKADQLWAENGQLEAWKTYGSDRRIMNIKFIYLSHGNACRPIIFSGYFYDKVINKVLLSSKNIFS